MRRRTIVISLAALAVAGAALGVALARGAAERRLVDLGACLIGEPLAANEEASDRLLRIELARPENIDPKIRTWPESCAELAGAAARSWGLAPGERNHLAKLAEDLDQQELAIAEKGRSADRIAWLHERRDLTASRVTRPWRPVTMSTARRTVERLPCGPWYARATAERAIYAGPKECAVVSTKAERLSVVRVARPEDDLPPQDRRPPVTYDPDLVQTVCVTEGRSIRVDTTGDRRKRTQSVLAAFFDEQATSSVRASTEVTSQFDDRAKNHERSLDSSEPVLTCSPGEVRVAWSWATSIGGKPHEELVVVTCVPGRCETKTTVVHIETGRHSNCGMCRPSEDQFQLEPLTVIDLFGATALLWQFHHALRVRVGPSDRLDQLDDHVLWYEPDIRKAYFGKPSVLTSRDVAVVGFYSMDTPAETRLFRLDAAGARELTIPK